MRLRLLYYSIFFFCHSLCCSAEPCQNGNNWNDIKFIKDIQAAHQHGTLFTLSEIHEGRYSAKIYKTDGDDVKAPVLLVPGLSSSFRPRWSPDGKWIAFLSDASGYHNLYLMNADNGHWRALTNFTEHIQTYRWSPDSSQIAFVMADQIQSKTKPSVSIYQHPEKINRLWIIEIQKRENPLKAYTNDSYCVRGWGDYGTASEEFDWSPDGQQIAFAFSPSNGYDDSYLDSSLALLNLNTGTITPFEKQAQHESMPRFSHNGKWIGFLSSEPPAYAFNKRVTIYSNEGKWFKKLPPTPNEGAFFSGPNLLGWTADDKHLVFFEPIGTKYHLLLLSTNGDPARPLNTGGLLISEPSLSQNGKILSFTGQTLGTPEEAYTTEIHSFKPMQISHVNELIKPVSLIKNECIRWHSRDGLEIEGLLTYPLGYQKGQSYPLILMIHGGPMSFFDEAFIGTPSFYSAAPFAEAGFMILRPNPRGSHGYGKKFRCLNYGDWGGQDMEDLITGVNALVNKGLANPEKLGVMGWSYGGYMTARLITQTSQFKAAIVGAGICNLVSFSGSSDLHRLASDYLGEFWQNPEIYRKRSPLHSVDKVATPCLILHGLADTRVPPSQAHEFYQALKKHQKEARMILYPGMGHGFHNPTTVAEMMGENLNWFKAHLKPRNGD